MYNKTGEYYRYRDYIAGSWTRPLVLYVNPVILSLGVLGNGFSFVTILWRKLYSQTPVFVFFLFISVTDLSFVISDGVLTHEYHLHIDNDLACQCVIFFYYSGMISSTWLLVAVTTFKLYGLSRPMELIQRKTTAFPYLICTAVIIVIYSLNISAFWTVEATTENIGHNVTISNCYYSDHHIAEIYNLVFMVAYSLGPGCLLAVLSMCICGVILRGLQQHKRLRGHSLETAGVSSTYTAAKNSAAMLIPLAFIHVSCTMPHCIHILFYMTDMAHHPTAEIHFVANLLWLVNHSMTVYAQMIISGFYRHAMMPCLAKDRSPAK